MLSQVAPINANRWLHLKDICKPELAMPRLFPCRISLVQIKYKKRV